MTLDADEINDLRNFYKYQHIQSMHQRNDNVVTRDLLRQSKCCSHPSLLSPLILSFFSCSVSKDEIAKMYEEFKQALDIDTTDFCLRENQFSALLLSHCPYLEASWTKPMFLLFDKNNNHVLSFTEYMLSLDLLLHAPQAQLLQGISEHIA